MNNNDRTPNYALRQSVAASILVVFLYFVGVPAFKFIVAIFCYFIIFLHGGMTELGWVTE